MPCCQGTKDMCRDIFRELHEFSCFFQIRFDMSCTRKKQQPLSLTDGDGRSGNHYYTVTRTNVNLLCWQHIQLFTSTLSPLPNLFFFSTALPSSVVSWPWHDQGRVAPKGFLRGSMHIWRKTNAERQALRGCCGGLVDRKVHSKKVHSQRMEALKMEWRSYSNM